MNIFRNKGIKIIVLLLLTCLNHAIAQDYTVRTFTTDNGLANNDVNTMALDSTGYLWIGTSDGLSRFDGYDFKNYFHIPGDTTSLPYFSVLKLVTDRNNRLWMLTGNSRIFKYDRKTDSFKCFVDPDIINPADIIDIDADENGDLWIICREMIIKTDPVTGRKEAFRVVDRMNQPFILPNYRYDLAKTRDDNLYLAGRMNYEIALRESSNGKRYMEVVNSYSVESSFLSAPIDFNISFSFKFYMSASGNKWLISNIGLFFLDTVRNKFMEYRGEISQGEFTDKSTFKWSWRGEGLYSYNSQTGATRIIGPDICPMTKHIMAQGDDVIWISVMSKSGDPEGVKQIVFKDSFFRHYRTERAREPGAVFAITKDEDNNLWASVRGENHIVEFASDGSRTGTGYLSDELLRETGHIRSLLRTDNGIWIGYFQNLLLFYDFESNQFIQHKPSEFLFRTITEEKNGNLLIGTQNLSRYFPTTGESAILWKSDRRSVILSIFCSDDSLIWAGTSLGQLVKYNDKTKESELFLISGEGYHIVDICPGDSSIMWLATLGGGLSMFDVKTGKTKFYTTSSGLSNNMTYCLLKDRKGDIWISTNEGISRLNTKTFRFRTYGLNDGLVIKEFNSGASYIDPAGEFFLGGMGGIVSFNPDSLVEYETIKENIKILVNDFIVSGNRIALNESSNTCDTIILLKGQSNFQVKVGTTDFVNAENIQYRYKLDRIDRTWTETTPRNRNINYSNLNPGWYTLHIQASNRRGEWVTEKRIVIRIIPTFVQTMFFKITILLLISGFAITLILLYINQVKQREKKKRDRLKLDALRGQMNPHFIFNSLNSINYFIAKNDKLEANRYIADFSRLIRTHLSNLEKDWVPFEEELESIRYYLEIEHIRFGDKFDYCIESRDIENQSALMVFPGLIQPFIENAIWHGMRVLETRKGILKIKFEKTENQGIKCTIEDDGIGRTGSEKMMQSPRQHKPMGIAIVIERLKIINSLNKTCYRLMINDKYADRTETGTIVQIDIPTICELTG